MECSNNLSLISRSLPSILDEGLDQINGSFSEKSGEWCFLQCIEKFT
jgi:hypothetical protein